MEIRAQPSAVPYASHAQESKHNGISINAYMYVYMRGETLIF